MNACSLSNDSSDLWRHIKSCWFTIVVRLTSFVKQFKTWRRHFGLCIGRTGRDGVQ